MNISVRFSVFVKSGGESFLLGATTAEKKNIMANDVALIVVSYSYNTSITRPPTITH